MGATSNTASTSYPSLGQSYKRRFPFRLSVPSFIYPADYLTNARRLGPFVDEIELLLLESQDQSLPSVQEIADLAAFSQAMNFSYNVHLPIDLDICDADPDARRRAVERMAAVLKLTHPLSPTTHTLHLACSENDQGPACVTQWQARTFEALDSLLCHSAVQPHRISIETLDYPPEWFAPLVYRLGLSVCLDVGHIVLYGFDLPSVLAHYAPRISIFHLHGVDQGRDHLGLDRLATPHKETMKRFLRNFKGTSSIEVFSFERLQASLRCLSRMMGIDSSANADRG